jgi:hypothetical protein
MAAIVVGKGKKCNKTSDDKGKPEKEFHEGDMVYVKLHSYRQLRHLEGILS